MMANKKIAAFFDLDRTLIDVNSAVLYAKFERRYGRISSWQLFVTAIYTALYHLNVLDMEQAYANATLHYKGLPEAEITQRTRQFFAQDVAHRLQPGAKKTLLEHRNQGHSLVLLTASSSYQSQAAIESWGLDHWIANCFPTQDGYLDGTFAQPLCYGSGKVELAEKWAKEHQIDLSRSYFYSDSFSDLPMLQRVGFPKVVNPDPKLKSYSKRMNWQILNWSAV